MWDMGLLLMYERACQYEYVYTVCVDELAYLVT